MGWLRGVCSYIKVYLRSFGTTRLGTHMHMRPSFSFTQGKAEVNSPVQWLSQKVFGDTSH